MKNILIVIAVIIIGLGSLNAQQEDPGTGAADKEGVDKKVEFSYGDKGWQMAYDDRFLMSLEWRFAVPVSGGFQSG